MRAIPLLCFAAAAIAIAAAAAASSSRPPPPLHLQATDQSERRVHRLNNAAAAPPLDVLAGSDQPPPQPQQPLHLHLRATDQSERRVHRLTSASSKIPPHEQVARVARFVAHAVDWAALATLSGRAPPGRGLPFASVFSVSDGPAGDASGVPYMYLSSLDVSVKDIAADPRVSMTMTLASTDYCSRGVYDPQSPLCARVTLIGNVSRVVDEAEAAFARVALFSRHPEMRQWPPSHGWFLARLDIASVWVVDYFGGPVVVSPKDYYNARP